MLLISDVAFVRIHLQVMTLRSVALVLKTFTVQTILFSRNDRTNNIS